MHVTHINSDHLSFVAMFLFNFVTNKGPMIVDYTERSIYRMTHYSNVCDVLQHGICSSHHPNAHPETYFNIGNPTLIEQRDSHRIGINPPGGCMGEYIPFYFGGHSPMLYQIMTGYGVKQIPQCDIVFFECTIKDVIRECSEWCFTDGHAKNNFTTFYNRIEDLVHVDWNVVTARWWRSTDDDLDRQRRKQAEFLVKDCVPAHCIKHIYLFSPEHYSEIESYIQETGLSIPIVIDSNRKLYY